MAHNKEPVEGCCNAKYKDGSGYCAKKSYLRGANASPTNKRCELHGGMSTGPRTAEGKARNATHGIKHGLYAQRLRNSFKSEDDRKAWDETPSDTDLTAEIQLCRMRVEKYQKLLEDGTEEVPGYKSRTTGEINYHSVHDLLAKAIDQLRNMTEAQQRMHPEAGTKGDMTITVKVDTGTAKVIDRDVEDLDAGGSEEETPGPQLEDKPDEPVSDDSPLAGLDDG